MKKKILIVISLAAALLIAFSFIDAKTFAFAAKDENPGYEEIENQRDFADDCVMVVLKAEYSVPARKPHESRFKVRNVKSANYLTSFSGNAEPEQIAALTNMENFKHIVSVALKNPGRENVLRAARDLRKLFFVESAEPNYYGSFAAIPDDAGSDEQDALEKIEAYKALEFAGPGAGNIKVGVIDSGIANHPDLLPNLAAGWDCFNKNEITSDDTYGHGTHVAGIIRRANPNVSLVPLQVLRSDLSGNRYDQNAIAAAIDYARLNNIPVINLSLNVNHSNNLETALANYKGLAVCAANNYGVNLDFAKDKKFGAKSYEYYPAAYSLDYENILTVGATAADPVTSKEKRGVFPDSGWISGMASNYGEKAVHLFAPGTSILSTYPEAICDSNNCAPEKHLSRGYHYMTGTSMAAPFVSGAAALLKSKFPDMDTAQIKAAIVNNVDVLPELDYDPILRQPLCSSGGRLNIYNSLYYSSDITPPDFKTRALQDGTIEIARFNIPYSKDLVIPSQIDGKTVTAIAPRAFSNRYDIATVSIPDTVTRIGRNAFYNTGWYNYMPNGLVYAGKVLYKYKGMILESMVINNIRQDTVSIADFAFQYCTKLADITIPSGVKSIGSFAFAHTGLKNITLGADLTYIGANAFYSALFTNIFIPDSVTKIDFSAFGICNGLTSVTIGNNSQLADIGMYAFYDCESLINIEIPVSVKSIGDYAFLNCKKLANITFESGSRLTDIGANAFENCAELISVTIPQPVKSIGDYAFLNCEKLVNVIFESGSRLTDIGANAFENCAELISLIIPASVKSIGNKAFLNCKKLANITFESGSRLTDIGSNAFENCIKLGSIKIPSPVTSIKSNTFKYCNGLTSVIFESGSQLASIGSSAFSFCSSLTNIAIPDSVTNIEQSAFQQTAMWNNAPDNSIVYADKWVVGYKWMLSGSVSLRDDTVGVCDYAFRYCTGLTKLTIPASVENIGDKAFYGCTDLTVIWFSNPAVSQDVFKGTKLITILQSNEAYIGQYDYYTERAVWCPAGGAMAIDINFEAGNGLIQLCGSSDIYADVYDLENNYIGSIAGGGWIGLDGASYKIIINNNGADGEIVKLILLTSSYYIEYAGEYENEVEFFFDGNNRAAVYTMLFYASADGTYLLTLDGADIHFGYGAIAYLTAAGYCGDTLETGDVGVYKIEMTTGWYFITFYSFGGSWSIGLMQ